MVALRAPRSATVGALLLAGLLARAQEDDDGLVVYGWDSDALEEQDEWGLPAFRERHIKVHHLSPSFGRNAGGLLVNATGKGASSSVAAPAVTMPCGRMAYAPALSVQVLW